MTKTKALALIVAIIGTLLYFKTIFYPKPNVWDVHNKAGLAAYGKGDFTEAEKQFLAALEEAEKFPTNDPRLSLSLNNLADFYQAQSEHDAAEPYVKWSLTIAEETLGPEHPNVAANLHNLGRIYHVRGMYREAEPLYKRALTIWEKTLGEDNPLVLFALENYINLLHQMGRNAEAESYEGRIKTGKKTSTNKVLAK